MPRKPGCTLLTELLHVSVLVSDLSAARAFYEGVLGLLPSTKRPALRFDGVWYEIGMQQLHLIALPNPDRDAIRPAHGGDDRHTAFRVTDMDALRQALSQAHIPHTLSQSGRKALFCRDPEGNALEFIEA